jgi:hypothetical protein
VLIQRNEEYLDSFLFALKTTETKRQYSRNLKLFFDFGFESNLTLSQQADLFLKKAIKDPRWTFAKIIGFLQFQKERVEREEIIWKRHNAHNDTRQGAKLFGRIHDIILFYTKTDRYTWNPMYQPYSEEYIKKYYRYIEPKTGRAYALSDLTGPGGGQKGNP